VLRAEQRLWIDRQRVATERVRVRRRVVREARQLSVTVRRENLVTDREPRHDFPVDTIGPRVLVVFEAVRHRPAQPPPTKKKSPSPSNS